MHFGRADLHPTAALLIWLSAVLATQFCGYPGLLVFLLVALIVAGSGWRRWLGYVRRARWLLLTLWLIMAYNTAGEALFDSAWAPTYEGVAEADLNVFRLLAVLACLAGLFERLGHQGLLAGVWGVLAPCRLSGLDTERLVVRLSLVLESVGSGQEQGEWRKMLAMEVPLVGDGVMQLEIAHWRLADVFAVVAGVAVSLGMVLL